VTFSRDQTGKPRERSVRELLRLYLATPGLLGHVRRAIPLHAVTTAFMVAAARRIRHNAYATPLAPIRLLHYFKGPIQGMLERPPGYREIDQLRETTEPTHNGRPHPDHQKARTAPHRLA